MSRGELAVQAGMDASRIIRSGFLSEPPHWPPAVGWVERSETQHAKQPVHHSRWVSWNSTHPTYYAAPGKTLIHAAYHEGESFNAQDAPMTVNVLKKNEDGSYEIQVTVKAQP